jgi:hypothetical protein
MLNGRTDSRTLVYHNTSRLKDGRIRIACGRHVYNDRDGMSNLYRGPSIDASSQVSDHLAKRFQRRRFLEIDQSETRIACGGHVC